MNTKKLDGFPPGSNPFCHDQYHMGMEVGKNVIVMYSCYENDRCDYLIIYNKETGERLQVNITEEAEEKAAQHEAIDVLLQNQVPELPSDYKVDLKERFAKLQEELKNKKV